MILAYVGNFDPEHSTENHVAKALENLGHEVIRIPEQRLNWSELGELSDSAAMVLWTRTAGFDPADTESQRLALKSLTIPSVGFHLDRWFGLRREKYERGPRSNDPSPFFYCDFLFTADGGHPEDWKSIGANHFWSPPAILSDEAKRVGQWREEFACDVAFVGNLIRYGHEEWKGYRYALYQFLQRHYGKRFKLFQGGIRGQDLADLYASAKVLIGDSCLAGKGQILPGRSRGGAIFYGSDRVPESLGRGGYLLHPFVEGFTDLFPSMLTYPLGDFHRLKDMIDAALADDEARQLVAKQCRAEVLDRHLYEHRMERVLSVVSG